MKRYLIEGLGWYGVIAIVGAYALVSFEYLTTDSIAYQLLNATGAIGIIVDAYAAKNYQPVVLNIFWLIIAGTALVTVVLS